MPIYQYQCPEGHVHERLEPMTSIADADLIEVRGQRIYDLTPHHACPECGLPARRIMAASAVRIR